MIDTGYPDIKQSLILLLITILGFAIFFSLTALLPQVIGIDLPSAYLPIVSSISPIFCLTPVIIYISKKTGVSLKWHLMTPSLKIIALLVLIMVCGRIVTGTINDPKDFLINLINGKLRTQTIYLTDLELKYAIIKFIGAVILTPIAEEILFRKQLLSQFLKKYSPLKAIFLSTALFAIVHLKPFALGSHLIWGILFGIVYYKTNSIEASIMLHAFVNLSYFFIGNEFVDATPVQLIKFVAILIISIAGLVTTLKYLKGSNSDRIEEILQGKSSP